MSQARTARRRRKQLTMNNRHLSGMGVSRYKKGMLLSVQDAIAAERQKAARLQAAKGKKRN